MNNTISEIKYTLEGINSRLDDAEDRISGLEDKVAEHTYSEHQGAKGQQGVENLFEKL